MFDLTIHNDHEHSARENAPEKITQIDRVPTRALNTPLTMANLRLTKRLLHGQVVEKT
jgi:hypothetical protein